LRFNDYSQSYDLVTRTYYNFQGIAGIVNIDSLIRRNLSPVPLPGSLCMLLFGILGMTMFARAPRGVHAAED